MTRFGVEQIRPTVVIAASAAPFDLAAISNRAREQKCSAVELAADAVQPGEFWQGIRAELAANNLICAGLALNPTSTDLGAIDAGIRAKARERVMSAIHDASQVGASYMRLVAARLDAMHAPVPRHEDAYHHSLDALLSLRHEAGLNGIRIVVEVAAHGFLASPPEARTFLDAVNSPWVGASLNFAACGSSLAASDWIETLTHRLGVIRMEGPDAGGMDRSTVGRALAAERFDGFILAPLHKLLNNDK